MPKKEPAQMTAGDTQPLGQGVDGSFLAVECAFLDDEARRSLDGGQAAFPRRTKKSGFGAAAQAGTKPRCLRRGGARQEFDVAPKRQPDRADATAIDPGCPDADEKAPSNAGSRASQARSSIA